MFVNFRIVLNSYIFTKEVLKIINKFLNNKITKLNNILNKVLKKIVLEITTHLVYKIYIMFVNNLLLIHYKESIIITFNKKSKKNYLLLKSYKLIVLENTFVKVVKMIFIIYLSHVMKKYS